MTTKKVCDTILDAIGHTPLVRINRLTRGVIHATVLAKIETFNPGNSIKDRMALKMIEDAERDGRLKPGGTIIEGTSGNTGMGLAIAAVVKGLQVHLHDHRQAVEGESRRAQGLRRRSHRLPHERRSRGSALVLLRLVAPRARDAELVEGESVRQPVELDRRTTSRRGRKSGSRRTARSRTSSCGVGTGGTICGVGRYLKEQNPNIKVWGIDTYGSVFKKYKETGIFDKNEIYPYITEGIGEDFLPKNVDFSVIDHFEKVTDKDAAIMTRRITREEGIFAGNSAGAAMAGLMQLRDEVRREGRRRRDLPRPRHRATWARCSTTTGCARRASSRRPGSPRATSSPHASSTPLVTLERHDTVTRAIQVMTEHDYSQIPVTDDGRIVGSVSETRLFSAIVKNPDIKTKAIDIIMQPAFPFVDISTGIDALATMITPDTPAVLVRDFKSQDTFIITRWDVMLALN